MAASSIELNCTPGLSRICLNEIRGADELAVTEPDTRNALHLLDRLITVDGSGAQQTEIARQLTTTDRDRLLAYLHIRTYGAKIESTMRCSACNERFDLDFSLQEFMDFTWQNLPASTAQQLEDGSYRLDEDCRFRLPTGTDELSAMHADPSQAAEQLLSTCLLEGDPETCGAKVQEEMAALAPVLQTEIQSVCPECGKEQQLRFDMQSFLLTRILADQKKVSWEIHRLAVNYGWSHRELIEMPRRLRLMYLSCIEAES